MDAHTPGAGKTLLVDLIALIVTGRPVAAAGYTNDEAELRKLITTLLRDGAELALFDNVAEPLGNSVLDRLLTSETWQDRLLGGNLKVEVPQVTIWFATGNSLDIRSDTGRRVLPLRLESPHERPEERTFRRPNLARFVLENRPGLLADVLLILRAWVAAGRPADGLSAWGSFGGWSEVTRAAVVWLGLADPIAHRADVLASRDQGRAGLAGLLRALERVDPDRGGLTAGQIVDGVEARAGTNDDWRALRDALSAMNVGPSLTGYSTPASHRPLTGGRGTTGTRARSVPRPKSPITSTAWWPSSARSVGCSGTTVLSG